MKRLPIFLIVLLSTLAVVVGIAAVSNPARIGLFTSTDGSGNPGTWAAVSGTGAPFTGSVAPSGMFVSSDGSGNPGTWVAASPTTFGSGAVPGFLQYFGDGSEGAQNCTSGTCNVCGEHWYSSLSISSGAQLSETNLWCGNGPTIIRVKGLCTIAGNLNASLTVPGTAFVAIGGTSPMLSPAGGGGGGTAAGGAGNAPGYATGGAAGAAGGGAGGTPAALLPYLQKFFLAGDNYGPTQSGSWAGGVGGTGGSSGGGGGGGGGAIILVCGSINFTGTITVAGQAGANSPGNNQGAGGGGGGGMIVVRSPIWTANTGTIIVAGGAGGTCGAFTGCGAGGTGGAGFSAIYTQ